MNDDYAVPEDSQRVRASGLPTAMDCAYRWEGDQMLGLRMPSSPRALLGSVVHHGTAVFDTALLQHNPISLDDAATATVENIAERQKLEPVAWRNDDITRKQVEVVALDLVYRYCRDWAPKTAYTAVELTVKPLTIDCGGGVKVTLTGTLDRTRTVVGAGGKPRVRDLKTGRRAVVAGAANTSSHRPQLGVYEVLTAHTLGVEVDDTSEVLGLGTEGKRPIAESEVSGCRDLVLGTPEYPGLLQFVADNLRQGRFPPNPRSPLCSPKYCARWNSCPYHA